MEIYVEISLISTLFFSFFGG